MATKTSDISKVGNNYYQTTVTTNTDGSLSATTSRTNAKGEGAVAVSTASVDKNGNTTRTYAPGATDAEKKAFADPNSPERQAYSQQVLSTKPYGDTPTAEQTKALNNAAGKPNQATNDGEPTPEQTAAAAQKDLENLKEGTRYKKGQFNDNLKYPENLQIEQQDVIEFNMLSYEKRSVSEGANEGLGSYNERSNYTSRTIGRVVLPIPGGISDTNSVTWGSDSLTAFEKGLSDIANSVITEGGSAGAETAGDKIEGVAGASGEVKSALASYFTGAAIGKSNILARTQGAIQNPNMELLFSGPSLRPFSFTFKLSARGKKDKEQITKIIRFFKQGMAVQRTASQLFLKAPNTFKIRYLHKTKDHPYINQIKECALQSFTVNYTPEGNYMTFADGLMTSYEISMQFQELEPIFNDDYSKLDGNKDTVIGY